MHEETVGLPQASVNMAQVTLDECCASLVARLKQIPGFGCYFTEVLPLGAESPLSQLWDLFTLGTSLCYLFDQLPEALSLSRINNSSFDPEQYAANPDKAKKRAIAFFAMKIREERITQAIPGCEPFTIIDLWDRRSTVGFAKVVRTVTAILDCLPPTSFNTVPLSPTSVPPSTPMAALPNQVVPISSDAQETTRAHIISKILVTERGFAQHLEILQKYSIAAADVLDKGTLRLLFPCVDELVGAHRAFLGRLESVAKLPWQDQRWGLPFIESENDFNIYKTYCAHYVMAPDILFANEAKLAALNHMAHNQSELPAMLKRPVGRICKNPLYLSSLIKSCSSLTYPYFDELKQGYEATVRVANMANEAIRRTENKITTESLRTQVDDWKGHNLENFGELLLDDKLLVTRSNADREYHVFLFEKIIVCCKDVTPGPTRRQDFPAVSEKLKVRRYLLKGRIFLSSITHIERGSSNTSSPRGRPTQDILTVWWKQDDEPGSFTLHFRWEDQMRRWEDIIRKRIEVKPHCSKETSTQREVSLQHDTD